MFSSMFKQIQIQTSIVSDKKKVKNIYLVPSTLEPGLHLNLQIYHLLMGELKQRKPLFSISEVTIPRQLKLSKAGCLSGCFPYTKENTCHVPPGLKQLYSERMVLSLPS